MLAALFNGVLPIFAISVTGYVCGRLNEDMYAED